MAHPTPDSAEAGQRGLLPHPHPETEDYAPLDDVTEAKIYCPDIGLVHEEYDGGSLNLVWFAPPR